MHDDWHATYRVQLHSGFPLSAAADLLPYLARLGITHAYLSPCLQALPGSPHGYDIADPGKVSDDLGGETAWRDFQRRAREAGIGVLLDIVPNHMAASAANPWWDDLLAHGPASRYAAYFDIFPDGTARRWAIHLATLGKDYGAALASGELGVAIEGDRPRLTGPGQSWPLCPASWRTLLGTEAGGDANFDRLDAIAAMREFTDDDRQEYERLVAGANETWRAAAAGTGDRIAAVNGDPDRLHALLEQQWYRLHYWKREGEVTNYRRFFDVGSLVGLRVEVRDVFADAHRRLEEMARDGEVQGFRVDHPDGLRAPAEYFDRLRSLVPEIRPSAADAENARSSTSRPDGKSAAAIAPSTPGVRPSTAPFRLYVEKILDNDERLRSGWNVDGTVGYDFLSKVNRLWMDEQRSDALSAVYSDFTGHSVNLPKVVREKKAQMLAGHFDADLDRLTDLAASLAVSDWRTRDLSRVQIREALALVTVLLPVYRTYLPGDGAEIAGRAAGDSVDAEDRALISAAVAQARGQGAGIDAAVFDFLEQTFLDEDSGPVAREVVGRWQQLTPAVTAKGVEDTTFYCYDRLVSCNEVGGQASFLGISSEKFHEFCHHLSENWPATLLATSTHDNKRSEDVRTRISVLSEDTERWGDALRSWSAMNLPAWRGRTPDRHMEYLLYQTLVGVWPIDRERAWGYLMKAGREAKIHTSWREPDETYEQGVREFVDGLFASQQFIGSLEAFVAPLVLPGRINSLAQTLIKLTAPGVPDFYQGTEVWDLSLVDPDNRRPVDFEGRRLLLERVRQMSAAEALRDWDSGAPKLWLIARTLEVRKELPDCYSAGSGYQPMIAHGERIAHVFGFLRGGRAMTLVPRFWHTLRGNWGDTRISLPEGEWENSLGGQRHSGDVAVEDLFRDFPVALLRRDEGGGRD